MRHMQHPQGRAFPGAIYAQSRVFNMSDALQNQLKEAA